ncbi:MAG: iron-containing alcohol dehydrogenase, partial [Fusobacterium sp. JB021]|nr:iron-containing alcohol dehydrogenase [Fusobacterium sp. JB021]
ILDPALPSKMTPSITANTGMDVMTHAIEAYVSTNATAYTDPLAMEAIKLVYDNLVAAYRDGEEMLARERMHNASALAGMAFTNSSLGLVHSLAHKLGGEFGITHGLANAILLPYVIEYNRKATYKYNKLEKELGILNIVESLKELNKSIGIPNSLQQVTEVEISQEKFNKVLERMSKNAFEDPCTATNPRNSSPKDVEDIYRAAYYGKTARNI